MDGFFVFDLGNDLVFKYTNNPMKEKLISIARKMSVIPEDSELNSDALIHIFNPLLANLRFMLIQFDNSFNYVKCQHGFNMVFDEYFGFLFITINDDKSIEYMQRSQGVFISFLRFLLGPAIYQLKTDNKTSEMLINLIEKWKVLYMEDQDVLLEVIQQFTVTNDVKKNVVNALECALEKLKQIPQFQRNHAVIFVGNKLLSMFSSRTSQQLTPADILFLNIFCQTIESSNKIESFLLFLRGTSGSSCMPHKVYRITINSEITLLLLSEHGNAIISSNLYETFIQLNKIKILQSQADMDALVNETENLDKVVKNVIDVQKKVKPIVPELDESAKNFQNKYESLKKKYVEMLKIMDKNQLVKVESYFPYFLEATKEFYRLSFFDCDRKPTAEQEKVLLSIASLVSDKILKYSEQLEIKSKANLSMCSYLDEFAGLVHFIFIDRQRGMCFTPNIETTTQETSPLFKKKVWNMIETSRSYLQNGQSVVIWKDFGFSYLYSLWFEDSNGQVLKPKDHTSVLANKSPLIPGMLSHDYYQNLIEEFFPKISNGVNKIKCFELLTVHLQLVSQHLQIEHSRRLVATIYDMNDMVSNNLFDLL